MIEIVNVLFVPVIPMFIWDKRNVIQVGKDISTIMKYCIVVVLNVIATYVAMTAFKFTIGIGAETNSALYTVVSAIVAFCMAYLYEILKKYTSIKVVMKENKL